VPSYSAIRLNLITSLDDQGAGGTWNQGGLRILKKYPGSFFFFKPLGLDLPTYVIRHIAIYGDVTSSS
jgi:hypothetical protein